MTKQEILSAAAHLEGTDGLDPWTSLMRVLLARLQSVNVPEALATSLAIAGRHWAGDPVDLVDASREVWRYIEIIGPSGADLALPEGRVARAVLCVLQPDGDEEARHAIAEWFAAMTEE